MTLTFSQDDARWSDAADEQGGATVTLLQEAAGTGRPVLFPGTLESRPHAAEAPATVATARYTHESAPPFPNHTGPFARGMMWLIDRLIALVRAAD